MSREVRDIPPAPRRSVRWSLALWHRWPLALLAFLLCVYGGLWTLMLFFASAGKPIDDKKLDRSSSILLGRVTGIEDTKAVMDDGAEAVRLTYEFEHAGARMFGFSFASAGLRIDDTVRIEYLKNDPHVNRMVGGRISLLGDYVTPAAWITVIPGVAVLITWLVGVLRLRDLLVHGDVGVAHVVATRELTWVVPIMLRVHFSFRDHRAQNRNGHHWVRARSRLGQRLQNNASSVAVVHDRQSPHRHHLIIADEFAL